MPAANSTGRRFKPELVETTTTSTSSRISPSSSSSQATNPSSSSSSKRSRFAPQPIETSTRSSRKQAPPQGGAVPQGHTPLTAAQTSASSKLLKPKREPELIPISSSDNHAGLHLIDGDEDRSLDETDVEPAPLLPHEKTVPQARPDVKPARRKFKVEVVETARRSRRQDDTRPALLPQDKTNVSPGDLPTLQLPPRTITPPLPPQNTPVASDQETHSLKLAPYRQQSIKPHYPSRVNTRQHSYRVPNLPDIESSESDGSDARSVEADHEQDGSDTSDDTYRNPTRMRESVDDRVSGYLLALAARAAEKQLRDQAAAAFPNTDYHEPVAHYMNRSDSDDEMPDRTPSIQHDMGRARRDSADDDGAINEMRKHGEHLFQQKQARKKTAAFNVEFDSQHFREDVWKVAGGQFGRPNLTPKNLIGGHSKDTAMKQMRKAASPPMLGGDIDFPRCASPDHARFDVTQGADYLRRNMCISEVDEPDEKSTGLWCGRSSPSLVPKADKNALPGPWAPHIKVLSPKSERAKSPAGGNGGGGGGGGLWGGFCNATNKLASPPVHTGLVTPLATPQAERDDPFSAASPGKKTSISANKLSYSNLSNLANNGPVPPRNGANNLNPPRGAGPPSPPASVSSSNGSSNAQTALSARLQVEARVDAEFDDAFITQVYNYLSLGYPSLAYKYDEELARIAKVPLEQLRHEDKQYEARGHVPLDPDALDENEGELKEIVSCKRWTALRVYVREWGRQMIKRELEGGEHFTGNPHMAWGLPARRGSWGL